MKLLKSKPDAKEIEELSKLHQFVTGCIVKIRTEMANIQHNNSNETAQTTNQLFEPIIFKFQNKYDLHIDSAITSLKLKLAAAITLPQMLTEILNNVYRHAQSQNVTIVVKVAEDKLKMIVTDFGIGFDQNQEIKKNHYGLSGLKNNVKNLYGTLTINSAVDEGTSIIVEIPLEVAKEDE